MVKKLAALAGAGAILLGMAGPAFGTWGWGGWDSGEIKVDDNWAVVKTEVYNKADSGDNSISGKHVWGGSIVTGAAGATSLVGNDVNSSVIYCDACGGDIKVKDNWAVVKTEVYNKADSGDNRIGGRCVGGGTIRTGAAGATSVVDNLVNFSLIGGVL